MNEDVDPEDRAWKRIATGAGAIALACGLIAGRGAAQDYHPAEFDQSPIPGNPVPFEMPLELQVDSWGADPNPVVIGTCDSMSASVRGIYYVPPHVPARHCSQQLNVFYPGRPSGLDTPPLLSEGPYPVVMFSPAGTLLEVSEGGLATEQAPLQLIEENPVFPGLYPEFLWEMLELGWVVVTIGGVGSDSKSFYHDEINGDPKVYSESLDHGPNVFYPHGSEHWNSADHFWGEKDFVWARQFLAKHQQLLRIDNDQVYVAGRSTGALYAAHCALGPERKTPTITVKQRDQDAVPTGEPDVTCNLVAADQLMQDTKVAGFIGLDLAGVWWPAYRAHKMIAWVHFPDVQGDPAFNYFAALPTVDTDGDGKPDAYLPGEPDATQAAGFLNMRNKPYDIDAASPYDPLPGTLSADFPPTSPAILGSISHWVREPGSNAVETRVIVVANEAIGLVGEETFARFDDENYDPNAVPSADATDLYPEVYANLNGNNGGGLVFGGLHSAWNAYTLFEDLYAVAKSFHEDNSELHVVKEHQVPVFGESLGPPFYGVTDVTDPAVLEHKYPYRAATVDSVVRQVPYAGHARGTFSSIDNGVSNAHVGVTQPIVKHWLEPTEGAVIPLGCGYNPAGSLVLVESNPTPGGSIRVRVSNPIQQGVFPEVLFAAQEQYIQQMNYTATGVLAIWTGDRLQPDPALPCGVVVDGFGMQFFVGLDLDPMTPPVASQITDSNGVTVRGRGELIVDTASNLSAFVSMGLLGGPGASMGVEMPAFPIPANPAFSGVTLYLQAAIADGAPAGSGLPYTTWTALTDALEVYIE